jgi:uncharacterized protein YprB with RNaseH-like and TPR domain/predicted nuclease with RNAse H fold
MAAVSGTCPKGDFMIEDKALFASFIQIKGVTSRKEKLLWDQGITNLYKLKKMQEKQLPLFDDLTESDIVDKNITALKMNDISFFTKHVPPAEYYRIAYSFPQDTIFLDIETTGLSRQYHYITMVGWIFHGEYKYWIQGMDRNPFLNDFKLAKILITFNGKLFDCKFLDVLFDTNDFSKKPQIDLRFLSRSHVLKKKQKQKGGQKQIETIVGFKRSTSLQGLDGKEAIVLWYQFLRGNTDSLKQLIAYNYFDLAGMTFILDHIFRLIQNNYPALKCRFDFYTGDKAEEIKYPSEKQMREIKSEIEKEYGGLKREKLAAADKFKIIGIDLSGKEERNTGICLLKAEKAITKILHTNQEIMNAIIAEQPDLVAIDAPLSLPEGRTSIYDDDPCKEKAGIMRYCEKVLKKRGVNVYPALIKSMQSLTKRGMELTKDIRRTGIPVIECFPGAAQDIIRIPRKKTDLACLKEGLILFGIRGEFESMSVTHDELDAVTAAVVGQFYIAGMYEAIGKETENYLIVPSRNKRPPHENIVIGIYGDQGAGKTFMGKIPVHY